VSADADIKVVSFFNNLEEVKFYLSV
jgi:hypothetical protein